MDKRRPGKKGNKKASFDSVFVSSLSGGVLGPRTKAVKEKKKRNRMGQNARRKKWELVYKDKANHLEAEKGKGHGIDALVSKKSFGGSKHSTIEKHIPQVKKDKSSIVKHSAKGDSGEQDLHPSWEASRKKKAQFHLTTFQGQRIKFTDSD